MTNTKTMIAIASLLTVGFASSAFASDRFLSPNVQNFPQLQAQQQRPVQNGSNAYAQAPAQRSTSTIWNTEGREFDRVTNSALFDR